MTVLLSTIATLSLLGILSAVILYFVAQKFKVEEDPRIDEVEKMLPGATAVVADSLDVVLWLRLWLSKMTFRLCTAPLAVPNV